MNYRLIILLIIILTSVFHDGRSQDIHFSQFFNAPHNLNPSLTGFSNARMRFYINHRNQWATVTVPFKTYAATIDAQLLKRKQKGDMFGIGVSAFSDKAGDSNFGTQSVSFSMNYVRALGDYSTRNLIGFGLQVSYTGKSIDYYSLYFDDQYDGVKFNPGSSSSEIFAIDNYQYYDVSAGVNWFTNINYDITLQTGLSAWHLNRPYQSLMNDKTVRLPIKAIWHIESEISFSKPYRLLPAILIQRQGTYTEIIFGSRFKFISSEKPSTYSAFLFGLFYRNFDAVIVYSGYQYKEWQFGISYDFNISTLRKASRYLGGFELNLNWQMPTVRHPKPKDLPCPIF